MMDRIIERALFESFIAPNKKRRYIEGRAGISPEMAVRLSIAFNTSAESWLNQQVQYDLWHAEKNRKRLRVTKLTAA